MQAPIYVSSVADVTRLLPGPLMPSVASTSSAVWDNLHALLGAPVPPPSGQLNIGTLTDLRATGCGTNSISMNLDSLFHIKLTGWVWQRCACCAQQATDDHENMRPVQPLIWLPHAVCRRQLWLPTVNTSDGGTTHSNNNCPWVFKLGNPNPRSNANYGYRLRIRPAQSSSTVEVVNVPGDMSSIVGMPCHHDFQRLHTTFGDTMSPPGIMAPTACWHHMAEDIKLRGAELRAQAHVQSLKY